jgi:hypothetical protein
MWMRWKQDKLIKMWNDESGKQNEKNGATNFVVHERLNIQCRTCREGSHKNIWTTPKTISRLLQKMKEKKSTQTCRLTIVLQRKCVSKNWASCSLCSSKSNAHATYKLPLNFGFFSLLYWAAFTLRNNLKIDFMSFIIDVWS